MNVYKFLIISIFLGLLFSCEDEDICIEQTTPKLHISFKKLDPSNAIDSIIVYREDSNGEFVSVIKKLASDPFFLPMPIKEQNQTQFVIGAIPYQDNFQDTLTITYDYELAYVSKACGFGVRFKNTQYAITSHFIKSLETLQDEIIDENTAHIQLSY